ncbi:MAG: vitamin K epoxide reductase [Actinobacteria bacterium]|nr:vitamin K epoxide reductase [Actinomycetota bacterium]
MILVVSGLAGLAAALWLSVEKYRILRNPGYLPSCSISEVVDCGTVVQSWQSTAFGFPNALIGVAAYPVVVTVAVLALAGASPRRWIWAGQLAGALAGTVFVHWLAWQTAYDLRAVCLYCMVVWASTLTILGCSLSILVRGAGLPAAVGGRRAQLAGWVPVGVLVWGVLLAVVVAFGLISA